MRHDKLCAQIHFNICKEAGVKLDFEQWYEHAPKSEEASHEGKIMLGIQQVQTDRASQHVESKETKVISIIIGVTGTILKSLIK
jgi:hypothetical protein